MAHAQKSEFKISMSGNVVRPGDTLDVGALYTVGDRKLPAATLDVIIQNQWGNRWNLRWPLFEGKAAGSIVLPSNLPLGKYDMWLAVQPRFLRLYGQVLYSSKKKLKTLEAALVSEDDSYQTTPLKVDPSGFFMLQDWLVYGHMTVAISTGNDDDILDIRPDAWLDSAYSPAAKGYLPFWVTHTKDTVVTERPRVPSLFPAAWGGAGAYHTYSPAQLYNAFYSWGAFRNHKEWMVDALPDSNILPQTTVTKVLMDKFAAQGIVIVQKDKQLWYEGKPLRLFVNELPTNLSTLSLSTIQQVAIIKLLPPAPNGTDYTLAVYTKRYPFVADPQIAQQVFEIRGYTKDFEILSY